MGFFYVGKKAEQTNVGNVSLDFIWKHQCTVCPLNHQPSNRNPHMKPYGSSKPLVYILGEAPGEQEDRRGRPFVGKAGKLLHWRIPENWEPDLRWNNVVRTRPPKNRTPTPFEMEACRPSIVKDIEQTKPLAIFGFGNVPLEWVIKRQGISMWAGRRIPIRVGAHACWYYPMYHPSFIARQRRFEPSRLDQYGCPEEFAFDLHLQRAFQDIVDLPDPDVHTAERATENLELITGHGGWDDVDRFADWLDHAARQDFVGMDYETKGVRPWFEGHKMLSIAIATKSKSVATALDHNESGWTEYQAEAVHSLLEEFLYTAKCHKIAHHAQFEMEWSGWKFGRDVIRAGCWQDTQSQSYILDERPGTHSLEFLCLQYFGIDIKAINNTDRNNLDKTPLDVVLRYNALDAKYHRLLYFAQDKELTKAGLQETYMRDLRRVPTMALTMMQPIPIDAKRVDGLRTEFIGKDGKEGKCGAVLAKIKALPEYKAFERKKGFAFKPGSTQDVHFMVTNIIKAKLPKEDSASTNVDALKSIKHPIGKLIIDYRHYEKMWSTYIKPLRANEKKSALMPGNVIRPSINLSSTRTWRTSASDLNIQNWPKREDKYIRSQVKPHSPTQRIVSFDFGQIQARNVAMESKDKLLVKAFWEHYDIHTDWARRICKKYPSWVPGGMKTLDTDKTKAKYYRNLAKNQFVFPSFFGAQPKAVSFYLGIPEWVGEECNEEFFDDFPHIKGWQERIEEDYYKTGYVTGVSGFRRRAPIHKNELINAPIQADEALIVCSAMAALSETGDERLQAHMEIHDDLTFVWEKDDIDELAPIVVGEMVKLRWDWEKIVPIVVEMAISNSDWSQLQDYAVFESKLDGGFRQLKEKV